MQDKTLIVVYDQILDLVDISPASDGLFYIHWVILENKTIELHELRRYYHEWKGVVANEKLAAIGPFDSSDTINQFCYLLCERFEVKRVITLSVQDYNEWLEKSVSKNEFIENLFEHGNLIEHLDGKGKKWGIFGKIF